MKKCLLLLFLFSFSISQAQVPGLSWAATTGGSGDDNSYGNAVDPNGNSYTAGHFTGTVDFDPGVNTYNLTSSAGSTDIFVQKLNSNGTLAWALRFGDTDTDNAYDIKTDATGKSIYITGYYHGTVDFDPSTGNTNTTVVGASDIFILKLDSTGTFVWVKTIGTVNTDSGRKLAVNADGSVYATGSFVGTADFDPSPTTTYNLSSASTSSDAYALKLTSDGDLAWAYSIGNSGFDTGQNIAFDNSDNVIFGGDFIGTVDFDPSANTHNLTASGNDKYIVKLTTASGDYVWALNFSSISSDHNVGLAVDASDNVYLASVYSGTVDFDPSASTANMSSVSNSVDAFVVKLNSSGQYVWSKSVGGAGTDYVTTIAVDATSAGVYLAGSFIGTADFDPSANTANLTSNGNADSYLAKLDLSGTYQWAENTGGSGDDLIYCIAMNNGIPYVVGYFQSTVDFDPGSSTLSKTSAGSNDVFVQKFGGTTTGIFDGVSNNGNLEFYPNPSNGIINLRTTTALINAVLTVTDISGRTLFQQTNLSGNQFVVDLAGRNNGVYIIQLSQEDYLSRVKVVKN